MSALKYIVTSDIHLGHNRTPTSHIIKSFKKFILTDANKDAKILFIAGDLFDQLLDLNNKAVVEIIDFVNVLLSYCAVNDIKLRVLEGTPSHDWMQSKVIPKLNDIRAKKVDLRYVTELDIEYLPEEKKYVLYIPDEWTNDHELLEAQIKAKLDAYGIDKVDIGIFHTQFKYQLGNIPYKGFCLDEKYFLNLVKGFIHIGHFHVFNPMDRIIPNGSLERLAHNEEGPKGYVVVNGDGYTFIENTDAWIYKTIQVRSNTTLEKLDANIYQYPKGSYIALKIPRDHPFDISFSELKLRYLDYNLKKSKVEDDEVISATYIVPDTSITFDNKFIIDSDLPELVVSRIQQKISLSNNEESKLRTYLKVFANTLVKDDLQES